MGRVTGTTAWPVTSQQRAFHGQVAAAVITGSDPTSRWQARYILNLMPTLPLSVDIESCRYLFLRQIAEPADNRLHVVVEEAKIGPEISAVRVGEVEITDCRPVESTADCQLFEIDWDSYVAYSVRNESYASADDAEEVISGGLLRLYARSHFLDYVSRTTFACGDYPGPLHHVELVCLNHIVDVVATELPRVSRT